MTQLPEGPQQPLSQSYPQQSQPYPQPPQSQQPYAPQQPGYGQAPHSQPAYPPPPPQQPYGYPVPPQGSYPFPPQGPQQPQQKPPYYKGNNWFGRQSRGAQAIIAAIAALVILVVIVGIASAGGTGSTSSPLAGSATATATSVPTDTPEPTATPDTGAHVNKGETITVTNDSGSTKVAATLVSVKTWDGDEFDQPKSGDTYVIVDVKLTNLGTDSYDYNEFDFHLLDGNGNISDVALGGYNAMSNQLHSGTLTPGGHVEGQIAFEAAKGDHAAQMTWQPSYDTPKDKFTWKLGL